jgi:outer membrane protein TolC
MEQKMKMLGAGPFAFTLIFALATRAAGAPLTLQQCIDEAIGHSPRLSAYQHKTAADREHITKSRGTTLPYVSSKLSTYMVNGSPATIWTPLDIGKPEDALVLASRRGFVNANAHWDPVGLQEVGVSYPLFYEGSILGLNDPPAVASARAVLTEDQLTAIIEAQKLILQVSEAFINAASFRDQLATNQQLVQTYTKELEITRAEVELGLILPQQITIVSAELEAARQAEDSARDNARDYTEQLAALMGNRGGDGVDLADGKLPLPILPGLSEFLGEVMPYHPALQVQDAKVEVARQQLKVDQATNLPTAKLENEFSVSEQLDYFNGSAVHRRPTEFLSYITVDVPIWDFGQRHAAAEESSEKVAYEKDTRADLELNIRTSIAETYGRTLDSAKTVADRQSKYVSANQALLLAQAQRKEGLIDELALATAEAGNASALVELEAAVALEQIDYADLQNLAGGVWHWML